MLLSVFVVHNYCRVAMWTEECSDRIPKYKPNALEVLKFKHNGSKFSAQNYY
jgi:hypothetical protein